MKLFFTPGSCTTGIHILVEELELVFEAHLLSLLAGVQYGKGYYINGGRVSLASLPGEPSKQDINHIKLDHKLPLI